jgi:uncharacterized protein DUF998
MSFQNRSARTLISCGVVAGPLFLLIFAIQVLARSDFRFTRSEPSALSIGPWGWVQIANFVIGGLLIVAGAFGVRRVLRTNKGGFWGPLLVGVFGVCQIGVGVFVTDPIGSPAMTFHGKMHLIFGGTGFTALMAACFVFVRAFASRRELRWAAFCAITGLLCVASFFSAANASRGATNTQLFLNVVFVLAWVWVSSVSYHAMRNDLGQGKLD